MNDQDKTKEELIKELQELQRDYNSLISSYNKDITQRGEIEEALSQSEEKYFNAFDQSPVGILIVGMDKRFIKCNPAFCKFLGYSESELIGKEISEITFPDDIEIGVNEIKQIAEGKIDTALVQKRYLRKDGEIVWGEVVINVGRDKANKPIYLLPIIQDITKRKLVENELQESEIRFRTLSENELVGVYIIKQGKLTYVNPAFASIFGYKPHELIGFSPIKLVHPDDQTLFSENIRRRVEGELDKLHYEFHGLHKNGKIVNIEIRGNSAEINNETAIFGNILDITNRKLVEAMFQDIIEMNPMSIQIVDKEGYTISGNQAFVDLFGIMPPADFSIFKDLENKGLGDTVKRARRGEVVHQPIIRYNVHDVFPELPDNPVWIKAVLFPLKDSNNTPERFVFMHENVTESKLAEEALRESEEKYKQIFDNAFDIMSIYEVTEDGRFKVVDFNAAEAKLIGNIEYYQNRYIDDCIPPDLYAQFKQNYDRCIAEEKLIVYDEEITYQNINKTFNTQLIPLKNSLGRIHRIIVISRDITDIKFLNTQLINQNEKLNILNKDLNTAKLHAEESDRLKSAFLANMSHEIRTPMNGIIGFARLLKKQKLSVEEQQEYLNIIEKSGDRMLNTINDIVNISKIEAGQDDINISDTNINEQTEFIYNFFKPESERKGLQLLLTNSLPANESIIKTDTEKVYSILTNLVNNAIKFTKKGSVEFGYILRTDSEPAKLEFFVKDTGIGISEEQKELIFERFRQTNDSLTRNFEGSGLGLPISKAYVEMLGGKIWVESSPAGSAFYFTLPYITEQEEINIIENDISVNERETKISNLKILIVEDDEISEKLISIGVKRFCSKVLIARTGIEAIEACRINPDIDLILMDMKMPEMDGYEATRQIRQFNKDVIIVAQTAFAMFHDRQKVMDAGCNDYFQKPISGEQLMALTQKYFAK
jgi:hypothetical protein